MEASDRELGHPNGESARQVFLAWERLRIVFNLVLIIFVLGDASSELSDREFRHFLIRAAFAANVCFCLGPVAEGYLAFFGVQRLIARVVVFVPGMIFGLFTSMGCLLSWSLRNFD
jgi:hypothetical protein